MRPIVLLFCLLVWLIGPAQGPAYAQANQADRGRDAQKKFDELVQSARRNEIRGYIMAGLGIATVVASIPVSFYLRRKKARMGLQPNTHRPDEIINEKGEDTGSGVIQP